MRRRSFLIKSMQAAVLGTTAIRPGNTRAENKAKERNMKSTSIAPRAITMWDFSWLERRWPGAGYEDWDQALDGLVERGYNAVRIDAYPHLVASDPRKEWTLLPVWDQQVWGSPAVNKVVVQPYLNEFLAKCRERDIRVGLSSWFREDTDNTRMDISSAAVMADIWTKTLDSIARDDLLDTLLYVDLCNEWPGDLWAPYFTNDPPEQTWTYWHTDASMRYMRKAIDGVRQAYPDLPYCFSFTGGNPDLYPKKDLSFFGLLEHHTWMAQTHDDEYYKAVGYGYERFSPEGYKNLAENFERVYNEKREYWDRLLIEEIQRVERGARGAGLPLITTECWGLVDFKDWPLLSWDIVKHLCELGTTTAAGTGQWIAIATSNFCGPQFVGMWRDVEWHRRLTGIIRNSAIDPELLENEKVEIILSRL